MQTFKTISFGEESGIAKSVSVSFSEKEQNLFLVANKLTSTEIRSIINIKTFEQLCLEAEKDRRNVSQLIKYRLEKSLEEVESIIAASDVTFRNSKKVPFQRWYPYIEGYSPDFVKSLIKKHLKRYCIVYEPFAGTGTTLFAADALGYDTYYSEINPLLTFLIGTKVRVLRLAYEQRLKIRSAVLEAASNIRFEELRRSTELEESYTNVFHKSQYFPIDNFDKILKMRSYLDAITNTFAKDLMTIAVLSSLIPCSYMKKQGDLRFKTKKEMEKGIPNFTKVFNDNISVICEDLWTESEYSIQKNHTCIVENAKEIGSCECSKIGCVLTSPPYLNGTNYIRNTKLELWFLGCLKTNKDLRTLRDAILTSGINDVKVLDYKVVDIENKSRLLANTLSELKSTAYDVRIPQMASCYFSEMYEVFGGLRDKLEIGAHILIDIGDSIFNGVHVQTDNVLIELLEGLGYTLESKTKLRERRSRNGQTISQTLIHLRYCPTFWSKGWNDFKENLPHQQVPYSKKNWGNPNHSLCSYQGKLKPAIAYHLAKTFIPEGGKMFDPFVGVGTIPFEASLMGRNNFGMDISSMAYYISQAKTGESHLADSLAYVSRMKDFIENQSVKESHIKAYSSFGLNRPLSEYYEPKTFHEILLAREFFNLNPPQNASEMVVISSLMHILHGNRPYALSRNSHPITPYAPTGAFVYKNVIEKLLEKVKKFYETPLPLSFVAGKMFLQDSTQAWPSEIDNLDAIITSPPFFDSTRFYNANWIRLWFSGWEPSDFKLQPKLYVDERQKKDFSVYDNIFQQGKERLKKEGVFVFHLGKSKKCDMGKVLQYKSKRWFNHSELFDESVIHCHSFGLKDIGTVTDHEYLVLY